MKKRFKKKKKKKNYKEKEENMILCELNYLLSP